jgi:hypothetical protein
MDRIQADQSDPSNAKPTWIDENQEPCAAPTCEAGCGVEAYSRYPVYDGNGEERMPALCQACRNQPLSFYGGRLHVATLREQRSLAINAILAAKRLAAEEEPNVPLARASQAELLRLDIAALALTLDVGAAADSPEKLRRALSILRGGGQTDARAMEIFAWADQLQRRGAGMAAQRDFVRHTLAGDLPEDTSDEQITQCLAAPVRTRGRPKNGDQRDGRDAEVAVLLMKESLNGKASDSMKRSIRRSRQKKAPQSKSTTKVPQR